MSVTASPVFLWNVERGEAEAAELWDAITEQQLADWEAEWIPELFKALQRLRRAGVPRQAWPQSRHWDWRKKTDRSDWNARASKLQHRLSWSDAGDDDCRQHDKARSSCGPGRQRPGGTWTVR